MEDKHKIERWPLLSRQEFNTGIGEFYNISQKIGEVWEINQDENIEEIQFKKNYLIKRNFIHEFEQDNKILYFRMDYHIIYHTTYQVPTLCFLAYWPDNKLMTLEEVYHRLNDKHEHLDLIKQTSFYGAISQMDHPILNIPYFYLHPCHTKDLMNTLDKHNVSLKNYIQVWLSLIGPPLGLKANLDYFK